MRPALNWKSRRRAAAICRMVPAVLAWLALPVSNAAAVPDDEAPGLALVGAKVHTVSGGSVPSAVLLVRGGVIERVGPDLSVPDGYRKIELPPGSEIYPAMIDADSDIGRNEIGSVRGTQDVAEVGDIHPHVRAEAAINADSEHIAVTRANGVLLALSVPRGGIVTGTSALIKLDGWNWADMIVKAPAALHVQWPGMKIDRKPGKDPEGAKKKTSEDQEKQRDEKLRAIKEAFTEARAYAAGAGGAGAGIDPRWESMRPVFTGALPVVVHGGEVRQVRAALEWASHETGLRVVLAGGGDIWRFADELRKRDIPVILGGIHALPGRDWEAEDLPYTMAVELHQAGVRFCIAGGGRNLPYQASTSVARGLPWIEGVRAITLYPARILGVDDRFGSIDPGKDATFFVTDGDLLELRTRVLRAFIGGREVDLANRQTRLYERYRAKPDDDAPPAPDGADPGAK